MTIKPVVVVLLVAATLFGVKAYAGNTRTSYPGIQCSVESTANPVSGYAGNSPADIRASDTAHCVIMKRRTRATGRTAIRVRATYSGVAGLAKLVCTPYAKNSWGLIVGGTGNGIAQEEVFDVKGTHAGGLPVATVNVSLNRSAANGQYLVSCTVEPFVAGSVVQSFARIQSILVTEYDK